ncbi:MAG: hypothetical protein ABIK89_07820 [Planctomycetota bacterium]
MQRTTNEIDASFYQLIHQLAGPQLSDDPEVWHTRSDSSSLVG